MFYDLAQNYANQIASFQLLLTAINVVIHIFFASAVAKDSGELNKIGLKTALVSGITWAFATLLGGVVIAAVYWFIHHSTFTRTSA